MNTFHMSETWPMRVSQMICMKKKTIQERDNLDNEEKNLHTINLTKDEYPRSIRDSTTKDLKMGKIIWTDIP